MSPEELAEGKRLVEESNRIHEHTVVPQPVDTDAMRWLWSHAAELLDAAGATVPGLVQYNAAVARAEKAERERDQLQAEVDRLRAIEESALLAFGSSDTDMLAEYAAELQNLRRWVKL